MRVNCGAVGVNATVINATTLDTQNAATRLRGFNPVSKQ